MIAAALFTGIGWLRCHELNPLLRSSSVSGSVSRPFNIDRRSLMQLSLIVCAPGCGHFSMCTIVSVLLSHQGQFAISRFPHLCIICLVAQNPVTNLVAQWHCLIVMPVTTVWIATQSIDSISMPLNLVLFNQ